MTGTRRAIVETGFAFAAVAGEPTPGGALGDPAGRRGSRRGLPSEDASNQKGSTFRRQSGILMDVHSVSPGSLLFDNSSFPGPGPNEQRVERSQLARAKSLIKSLARARRLGPATGEKIGRADFHQQPGCFVFHAHGFAHQQVAGGGRAPYHASRRIFSSRPYPLKRAILLVACRGTACRAQAPVRVS